MLSKPLILGSRGLLGQSLGLMLRDAGLMPLAPDRAELDVLDFAALQAYLDKHKPTVIFNAVAYTQVDKAEDEPDEAMRLNRDLPAALAGMIKARPTWLIHYSTDFVFDGSKRTPYFPEDATNPQSVYGYSKLAGEEAILSRNLPNAVVVRTAWLFGPGKRNFVSTILGKAMEGVPLRVVDDQIGSPTFSDDLAQYSISLAQARAPGLFHIVNRGQASWYEFAKAALQMQGLPLDITAVKTGEFPVKAVRPAYSVLHTRDFSTATGIVPRAWTEALQDYLGA